MEEAIKWPRALPLASFAHMMQLMSNPDSRADSIVRPLWRLIVFGALAAGVGELGVRLLSFRWSPFIDKSFHLDPQSIWMGPVALLPLMALVAGIAHLIARRARHETIRNGLPLGSVLFLAAFEVAITTTRVQTFALAILAAGLAVQVTRMALARPRSASRLLTWTTVVLAVVSVGGGLGWNLWRGIVERRLERGLPAAAPNAPNVLLLILDTVRAQSLSVYGYHRPTTPTLESLARDGIRFDRALATAPWTLPSHASLFTGRYPPETGADWNRPMRTTDPTIAEAFSQAGFATGGFVANLAYTTWLHGLSRGFQHYADYPMSLSQLLGSSNVNRRLLRLWNRATHQYHEVGSKNAELVNGEFLRWLDRRPSSRPFFAFLNYFDAHMPYLPPAPYRSLYLVQEPPTRSIYQDVQRARPTQDVIDGLRDTYDGAITYLDAQLGRLFAELERRGLAANTIIVVTSDHGEAFGEHGFLDHGASLYLPELHVPLIVRLTGQQHRGCVVNDWVTLRDLAATLSAAAALTPRRPFPGRSLLDRCGESDQAAVPSPLLAETTDRSHLPEWYPVSAGALQGLVLDDLHYVRTSSGVEQLFDTRTDYAELRDLSRDSSRAAALDTMRQALARARR